MARGRTLVGLGFVVAVACTDDSTTVTGSTTAATEGTSTSSASTSTTSGSTGDTTSTSSGVDGSTSGGPSLCGNGDLDPGEECDDGNLEQLDDCRADCTIPFEALWTVSYDGPDSGGDYFNDVTTDAAGNVYAVGNHRVQAAAANLIVKQYGPDGSELWTYEYAGELDQNDFGSGLAWHSSGDLLVVGTNVTSADSANILVLRIALGEQVPVWLDSYNGPGTVDSDDRGAEIAADPQGNVVVVGSQSVDDQSMDIVVRKYDADGGALWTQTHDGAVSGFDVGHAVAVDADGNVFALGRQETQNAGDDGWLRKYDPDGNELWTHGFAWVANDIAVDDDGNIVLGGIAFGQSSGDIMVEKYDPTPALLWQLTTDVGQGNNDVVTGVAVDAVGDVYVAGLAVAPGQAQNVWAARIDAAGQPQWAWSYDNRRASLTDQGDAVTVDGDGNVIVAGFETVFGMQENAWLRKLAQL